MKTQVRIPESETFNSREKGVSRRDFLKFGVSSFLGLIAMQHLQSSALTLMDGLKARAKHCIVLFMNGGASQLDTFDPKPDTLNAGPSQRFQQTWKASSFLNIYLYSRNKRTICRSFGQWSHVREITKGRAICSTPATLQPAL